MSDKTLRRNTIIGLLVSLALAAGKMLVGVLGHSSAMVADAVESLADSIGSSVVWQGIRVSSQPPDQSHPYGYGKAEAVSAFCVGAMLLVAAVIISVKAVHDMMTPHGAPAAWTLIVFVPVIVLKETLSRFVMRGAAALGSSAARADALHHRADAITSFAALIGVAIAVFGPRLFHAPGLVLADEVAAMIGSVIIMYTGVSLIRPSLRELLDATAPELAEQVKGTAGEVDGVRLVEKVHARKSGRGYHIDMHLHVAPDMAVLTAHSLAGKVKAHIRERHPSIQHVLIHIEPDERTGT
ncbi:MAG: cation transporter [Pyrinomonadaceae bacterium]|nr:cation transporter [Phycisphaerales bacterium]